MKQSLKENTDVESFSAPWLRKFRTSVLAWYAKNARDLPWRATQDAYSIWLSEIMLQQTQVATVLPYYRRFLERFPNVKALADAREEEVLKLWEGLGYYRRARQLHAAAKTIVAEHAAEFPTLFDDVLALAGIGRYTAGAICSFAYNQPTPIVEANTQRLYARILKLTEPLDSKSGQAALWEFADKIVDKTRSRQINSAVMELGAIVCTPKPTCNACPLRSMCPTYRENLQAEIPVPKKKIAYESRFELSFLVQDAKGCFLVKQCDESDWWAGLWDFPRTSVDPTDWGGELLPQVENSVQEVNRSLSLRPGQLLFTIRHSVTKYRITLNCYPAEFVVKRANKVKGYEWASIGQLDELPMSASGRKIVEKLKAVQNSKDRRFRKVNRG
jgi:A/G-specific adenine glycosylase